MRANHARVSTGRSVVSSCAARAALAGNPSDGYGGAVVAIPITDLRATAAVTEATGFEIRTNDAEVERLLDATAAGYAQTHGSLPSAALSVSTVIPRSVGLAGSSALIIAALRALAGWSGNRWAPVELAELALSIERDRLGIAAGLQDRLVQAVDHLVAMTFDPVDHVILRSEIELPLFVAWSRDAAETSDTVHRSLRRRFDGDDPIVVTTMNDLSAEAGRARRAIENGDLAGLGEAMDRSFDLRTAMIDVGDHQRRLVSTGRDRGAWVNSAGSGGSVVGLVADPDAIDSLRMTYEEIGAEFLELV